jgi:hypothetical protein
MPPLNLVLYTAPHQVDTFVNIKRSDGTYERITATIDTGADTCFFPQNLLSELDILMITSEQIIVEQAGVAGQEFRATEAVIRMFLEDYNGNRTEEFETIALFAETHISLIGFENVLDRATLHVDFHNNLEGWIELD